MRDFQNIDKSAFRKGEYVGYAAGTIWRIVKLDRHWQAIQQHGGGQSFTRDTLADVSAALETTAAYLLHIKA